MLRDKVDKLNKIIGRHHLPEKIHRDLIIIAIFDNTIIYEANTYFVEYGSELAQIAIVDANPEHHAYIIARTHFRKYPSPDGKMYFRKRVKA